jgi:hypothetical protein
VPSHRYEIQFPERNGEDQLRRGALYDHEVKLNQQQHRKNSSKTLIPAYLLMIFAMAERGGLYCSIFRNSHRFCHLTRNTCIFCRLRTSLSSHFRLSNALQSLLWTSKVPKKSNMSNKTGFPSDNLPSWKPSLGIYRPQEQPQGGGLLI